MTAILTEVQKTDELVKLAGQPHGIKAGNVGARRTDRPYPQPLDHRGRLVGPELCHRAGR
ncbi:MAG: hypothetical protein R6W48_08995 [Gaiellaceae bacterium]